MTTVQVELGPRSYPVHVGTGVLNHLGETLRTHGLRQTQALIITNPEVGGLYYDATRGALESAGLQSSGAS
jgi:3-dehydroquinate synthase